MPLTPADVHNVAFSKPPIGKRGYNEDEVDQFLDLVEDTLAQLQEENDDLTQRVEELETQLKDGSPAGASAAGSGSPRVDESALRREIEEKIRAEYKTKLDDAQKTATKAQNDAKAAQDQLQKAQADAKAARDEAEKAKANTGSGTPAAAAPAAQAAPAASGGATVDTHMQAAKVLGLAQEMADRLTSDARAEAKSMLDDAREAAEKQISEANTSSNRTLEDARQRAEKQIADAESRAKNLVDEAESRAKNLVDEAEKKSAATLADSTARAEAQIRQAEDKANALQADAERKHTETMAAVKEQQNALETRIAELQVFEREYRTRLKSLLEGQLEELNARGSSAPAGNTGNNPGGQNS
ncbi:DivIVA domain-containing protein [Corynebacterium gallinarum]|uniref:Cell wall synthesis protein Wag31 n=1 Tax=Corynebacterium gallinarum TaxID=2762214 RepID=A0A8I0HC76_9CORY|nr:DivIVA domain-containing protein [Corynebacterium gallinarum]MBD8028931.1 DivIVA domain-containing protein [Corynebacterium gallinarum]